MVNRRAPMEVFEKVSEGAGTWVTVDVRQVVANRRMVGGFVEVRDGERFLATGDHRWQRACRGAGEPHHFGVGSSQTVEMRLVAPDGRASPWQRLAAGRGYLAVREDGGVRVEPLPD